MLDKQDPSHDSQTEKLQLAATDKKLSKGVLPFFKLGYGGLYYPVPYR